MAVAERRAWPVRPIGSPQAGGFKQVFIGLDFGTTFTKVSYRVTPALWWNVKSMKFFGEEDPHLFPSVVWLGPDDKNSPRIQYLEPCDPESNMVPVKYFKYSMVLPGLVQPPLVGSMIRSTKNGLRIVSAFFLGNLLKDIRDTIVRDEKLAPDAIQWFVNLGIPAGTSGPHAKFRPEVSDHEVVEVFSEVLNVAWKFSNTHFALDGEMSLAELDRFYDESKHERDYTHLNCIPELYAEVLLYYQDKNVPEGFYCVVDVGGGTVDVAVFYKEFVEGNTEVSCVAHAVAPLGFESLLERVALPPVDEPRRNAIASLPIPYDVLGHFGRMKDTPDIMPDKFDGAVHQFELAFGKHCLDAVRLELPTLVRKETINRHDFSLFLLGGGRGVQFYRDVIGHMSNALEAAGFPGKRECDILDYVREINRFAVVDNSRLLISQMLAQPFNEIPKLDGSIWRMSQRTNRDLPLLFDIQSRVPIKLGMRVRHCLDGAGTIVSIDGIDGRFDVDCDNGKSFRYSNPAAFETRTITLFGE